jgi:hypothetical protein
MEPQQVTELCEVGIAGLQKIQPEKSVALAQLPDERRIDAREHFHAHTLPPRRPDDPELLIRRESPFGPCPSCIRDTAQQLPRQLVAGMGRHDVRARWGSPEGMKGLTRQPRRGPSPVPTGPVEIQMRQWEVVASFHDW